MTYVDLKNNRLFVIASFLIFFLTLLLRLPGAIIPPTDYFYDSVERSEIYSIFGLFAGLIPAGVTFSSLGIYGIPLVLFYTLDFVLSNPQVILSALRHNSGILVRGLSIYIANAFLDPTRHLIMGRIFVAVITSFAPLALFGLFYKRRMIAASIFSTSLFLTSPFLVEQNYNLMPDSIALTFFTFALVTILGKAQLNSRSIFIGSLFLGLAIAAKFIYIAFLPVAGLAILFDKGIYPAATEQRNTALPINTLTLTRNLLLLIAVLLSVVLIFIPFIWTTPLVWAKNLFGTLKQYYSNQHCWRFVLWGVIPVFITWIGVPFSILGFVFSFSVLEKKTAILLAVSFLSFLFPLGAAVFILKRYALSLLPYLCIYAGIGIHLVTKIKKRNLEILFIGLFTLGISISNFTYVKKRFEITHGNTNSMDCVNWIKKNMGSGSRIALPVYIDYFFIPSEATLERWINKLNNSYDNIIEARLNNLFSIARSERPDLNSDNPLVPRIFGALEQQMLFVYKMQLWYFRNVEKAKISYNLFSYLPDEVHKLGIISSRKEELLNQFLDRKIDLFVSDEYLPIIHTPPVKYCNRFPGEAYYIYLNNKPTTIQSK